MLSLELELVLTRELEPEPELEVRLDDALLPCNTCGWGRLAAAWRWLAAGAPGVACKSEAEEADNRTRAWLAARCRRGASSIGPATLNEVKEAERVANSNSRSSRSRLSHGAASSSSSTSQNSARGHLSAAFRPEVTGFTS